VTAAVLGHGSLLSIRGNPCVHCGITTRSVAGSGARRCNLHGHLFVAVLGEGSMKRFLIFTVLFPPFALAVFIATEWCAKSLPIGLLFFMLGYAYPIAVIPAWLTAGVGWVGPCTPSQPRNRRI